MKIDRVPDFDNPANEGRLAPMGREREDTVTRRGHEYTLNAMQEFVGNWRAKKTYLTSGRGTGKTSLLAVHWAGVTSSIQLGSSAFLGSSIAQLYKRTFPAIIKGVEKTFGWTEGKDFIRGCPPSRLQWPRPLTVPRAWDNVVIFRNGHCCYLSSMAVLGSINGMSIQALMCDEARLIPNWQGLVNDTFPAVRSEMDRRVNGSPGWDASENPFMLSHFFCSDKSISAKGRLWERDAKRWAEDPENVKVNVQIAEMLAELKVDPRKSLDEKWVRKLNRLRCKSTIYMSFPSTMNASLLGEDWFREKKLTMTPAAFDVQIMGKDLTLAKDGYYQLNEEIHLYLPDSSDQTDMIYSRMMSRKKTKTDGGTTVEWESPDFDAIAEAGKTCDFDTDLHSDDVLRLGFDYGANLNCLVVGVVRDNGNGRRTLYCIKEFFTKDERKLRALVGDFCRYYEPHRRMNRNCIYYSDSTSRQGGAYSVERSDETRFCNVVIQELRRYGWVVQQIDMRRPMLHDMKYQYINDVLMGATRMDVRINSEQCQFLILALQQAAVARDDRGGIKKDKHIEKYKESEDHPDTRTRTDVTDAFDSLVIGCGRFRDDGHQIGSMNDGVIFSPPTILI